MTKPDFIAAEFADDYDPDSLPVDRARHFIRSHLTPVTETETLPLLDAMSRVLAKTIISPCNVPNRDNSAMDGFALNWQALPAEGVATLKVIGTALAGKPYEGFVGPGECVRIMTGAVMPDGCDTVVMQEHAEVHGNEMSCGPGIKLGQNRRLAGEDLQCGQAVLQAGHWLRPADLGLIASLGIGRIEVYRKLRVAFFSTGDELASIGTTLRPGEIYDSNRYTIYGMLTRLGVEIIDMGVVRDDPALLEETLLQASRSADVILSSGGVSVGEADYMKALLNKLGQVVFWKIAMKPGRPLAYGKIGTANYFGLPGNPVSVMVTFYQFVRHAMLILMGKPDPAEPPLLSVTCTEPIRKVSGRTEFQRGILSLNDGKWTVRPTGNQGSGILRSMSEANCFIVLPATCGNTEPGSIVQVQVMDGII